MEEGRDEEEILEARGGIEPPIKVLQTFALPLGDRAPGTNFVWQGASTRSLPALRVNRRYALWKERARAGDACRFTLFCQSLLT